MLKKFVWNLLATATGMNFHKEYQEAVKANVKIFLRSLLLHAYNNVPYYHRILEDAEVIKNGNILLDNFEKVPILTKDLLRKKANELISRDYQKRDWFYNASSGSTSEPVRFIQDRTFSKWTLVTSKYYYENILGISETFAKKILLWISPIDNRGLAFGLRGNTLNNALTNTKFLYPLYITESGMQRYVKVLNSYKPVVVRGYTSALYEIAKFINSKKLSVHKPAIVISSAEVLEPHVRELIENAFNTEVFDFYGSRELDGIAGECNCGLLHIFIFNNYVEILDMDGNKVKESENGKVIVTALHNYSMPLIRYDIGDMAKSGPEKCGCGIPLPTLSKIVGRVSCFFRKENGTIVEPYIFNHDMEKEWVKAYRMVQEDYQKIRIIVVPSFEKIDASEKRDIEGKIRTVMGRDCVVTWDIVDEIPKTRSGKLLTSMCLLPE